MTAEGGVDACAGAVAQPAPPVRDRRPLWLVLTANVISVSGSSLSLMAVPWFVLQTTGSAARAGVVAFCGMLPMVGAALFGGPVIDRMGRRRASVVTDVMCAVAVAAVPLLHFAGALRFWELCALMAVSGLFGAPGQTARTVLLPALAERAGVGMTRAAGFFDGASRGARMAGAAVGGVLIAFFGPVNVLLLDAGTFAVSALLIGVGLRGMAAAGPRSAPAGGPRQTYRAELREGVRALTRSRLLLGITLMVMVTNGLDQGWNSVLLPVLADRRLGGAVDLGLLTGLFAGSALAGALLYGAVGHRFSRWAVYTGAFIVCGLPRFAMAAYAPHFPQLAAVMVLDGLAAGMLNPVLIVVIYDIVPEELRSRVLGVTNGGVMAFTPLGGLVCGFLADAIGLTATLLAAGGLYLLATLCPLVFPSWRTMDRPASSGA